MALLRQAKRAFICQALCNGGHVIRSRKTGLVGFAVVAIVVLALGGCRPGGGTDEIGRVLLALLVAMVAAKLGGEVFVRLGQPAVLGELILGIVVGNLSLVGYGGLEFIRHDHTIEALAEIGVVLLLFQVGLESDLGETMKVGASSLVVATLGVIAPFFLGWGTAALFLPAASVYVHVFVGATLCATSIGITARIFRDLGRTQTPEARITLGAAVLDDVMGLVVLAVVQGLIVAAGTGEPVSTWGLLQIVLKAILFLMGVPLLGRMLAPRLFDFVSRFKTEDLLLITSLAVCFGFSYLASLVGLAPIVGAFAAGLVLEKAHWQGFVERGEHSLDELMLPLLGFLVPVFFFRMGMGVLLPKLAHPEVLLFAGVLTIAAIAGKQICALGVLQKGLDRLSVGIGMIPRGEVGLIFGAVGSKLMLDGKAVIEPSTFSVVVIMVVFTTLITPPLLKWSLSRRGHIRL